MRTLFSLLAIFIISISFQQCTTPAKQKNEKITEPIVVVKKDSFQLLCQFWQLTDAEHPTSKDISFTNDNGILFNSGIVFMTDSVFLENPAGEMAYGKFKLNGNVINATFDNGVKAVYQIGTLNEKELFLKRTINKQTSELTYTATNTDWTNANKNPFSKQNYQWVIKPKKAETDEAIKNRAKECVNFYADYFSGFANGGAKNINFEALPSCFNWYQGGITIQSEAKLDKKWANCFYSEEQAFKARQLLEDALSKKYDWDTTQTNWIKQTASVLQQIHDGL
jgi:hypothetical protein